MTNGHTGMDENDEDQPTEQISGRIILEQQQCSTAENPKDFIDQIKNTFVEAKQNYRFDISNVENLAENVLMIGDDKQQQQKIWQKLLPNMKIEQIQANNDVGLLEEENVDIVIDKLRSATLALAV